jgi:hypothetical protein
MHQFSTSTINIQSSLSSLEEKIITLREKTLRELFSTEENFSWIPLQVRSPHSGNPAVDIDSAMTIFLQSNKKILLLSGHATSGKTVSSQRFVVYNWRNYGSVKTESDFSVMSLFLL